MRGRSPIFFGALVLLSVITAFVAACAGTVAIPPPLPAPIRSDAALYPSTDDAGVDASDADVEQPDAADADDGADAFDAAANGGLTPAQIRFIVMYHLAGIRGCYDRTASKRTTPPSGELALAWQIAANGVVTSAEVLDIQTAIDIPELRTCILHEVRSWQFPASDHSSIIPRWPFRFGVNPPR